MAQNYLQASVENDNKHNKNFDKAFHPRISFVAFEEKNLTKVGNKKWLVDVAR